MRDRWDPELVADILRLGPFSQEQMDTWPPRKVRGWVVMATHRLWRLGEKEYVETMEEFGQMFMDEILNSPM